MNWVFKQCMNGKVRDLAALSQQKKPPSLPRASFGCSGEEYLTLPRTKSLFPVHSADILIQINTQQEIQYAWVITM